MRTIATLKLPATTSGIWRFAPPCAAPAVQSLDPPPPLAAGVALPHAPTASAATANRLASRSRVLPMGTLLLRVDRAHRTRSHDGHARARGDLAGSRHRLVRTESSLRRSRPEAVRDRFRV